MFGKACAFPGSYREFGLVVERTPAARAAVSRTYPNPYRRPARAAYQKEASDPQVLASHHDTRCSVLKKRPLDLDRASWTRIRLTVRRAAFPSRGGIAVHPVPPHADIGFPGMPTWGHTDLERGRSVAVSQPTTYPLAQVDSAVRRPTRALAGAHIRPMITPLRYCDHADLVRRARWLAQRAMTAFPLRVRNCRITPFGNRWHGSALRYRRPQAAPFVPPRLSRRA